MKQNSAEQLHQQENVPATLKWAPLFLVLLGMQYLLLLQQTMKTIYDNPLCDTCGTDALLIMDWSSLLYLPAIFYQLYKRRAWGWALMFVNNFIFIALRLAQTQIHSSAFPFQEEITWEFILPQLIRFLLLVFLFTKNASRFFKVTAALKLQVLALAMLLVAFIIWGIR